jgi:signal peptidase I
LQTEQGLSSLLAFTDPREIVLLLAGFVLARVAASPLSPSRRLRAYVLEFVDSGIIAILLIFCIVRPFLLQAFLIPSGSMHPTLLEGDRIFVNKAVYFIRDPRDEEVVVFHAPVWADPMRRDFIKRVIGVPGDRIAVHDGHLYRNGAPLDEPYIAEMPDYAFPSGDRVLLQPGGEPMGLVSNGEVTVPKGHIMVMGDNRNESNDAHIWHAQGADGMEYSCPFVPRENVIGRAVLDFWPPGRLGLVR